MSQSIDHHVSVALAHLLGAEWQTRLRLAVACAAAGERLPPQRHWTPGEWTAERVALLREIHGTIPARQVFDRINAMPGNPITSVAAMRMKVKDLALPPPPNMPQMPDGFDGRWTPEAREAHAKRAARLRILSGGGEWTDVRLYLLRANILHPSRDELLAMINALPGNPIASVESMMFKSRAIGLKRPRNRGPEYMRALLAKSIAARKALAPVPVPAPILAAPPAPTIKQDLEVAPTPDPPRPVIPSLDDWTEAGELTPEAEEDAIKYLAQGWSAAKLLIEFGEPTPGWWQEWRINRRQSAA